MIIDLAEVEYYLMEDADNCPFLVQYDTEEGGYAIYSTPLDFYLPLDELKARELVKNLTALLDSFGVGEEHLC